MINFCRVSYFCLGMGINLSDSDVTSLDLVPRVVPFDGEVLGSLLATFTMDSEKIRIDNIYSDFCRA